MILSPVRFAIVALLALPSLAAAQAENTLGTLGAGVAGERSTPGKWTPPTGAAPSLASGKPDFSGVWGAHSAGAGRVPGPGRSATCPACG